MDIDHTPSSVVLVIKLASLAALLAVGVGTMVLVGWAFDIAVLKSVLPGWIAMKANTAVCFILIGIALLLTARPQRLTLFSRFARLCGLLAGLIGLLTLGEYLFGWNPGIDQWLVREPAGAVGTSYLGRMAPETALCFVLLAVALWVTGGLRKTRWTLLASASIGLLVAILALAAMLSYPMPSLGTYGWFGLTIMAMHTAILFAMLGMAVIAINWQQDILQWSLGRNTTAAFACGMAVLVLIGFNTNQSQFWLGEMNHKIAYNEEILADMDSLVTEIIDAQAHVLGYVITGEEQFKAHHLEAKAISNGKLDALRKLVADNPYQQQQFARIEAPVDAELQWFQQAIDAGRTGINDDTRNKMIARGEELLHNIHITFKQIESDNRQLTEQLKRESESVSRFSYITIATGTLASLLIFMVVIFRLNFAVIERKQVENALRESEVNLTALVEHSPIAMIVDVGVDADEKIIMLNQQFTNLFGYTMEDVPDVRHWWPLAYPDEKYRKELMAEWAVRVEKAIQSHGCIEPMETTVTGKDGSNRYIRISLASIGSRNIVTFEDFTERKRAEKLLQSMATKFHAVFESSSDAIMLFDGKGFLDCNMTALRMFGCPTRDEFIGKHPAELSPPTQPGGEDSMSLANARIATAFKSGSNRFEWTHRRLDGAEFLADVSLTALKLDGKRVLQATVRDITERNQAKLLLAEQFEELRRWHDATLGREMRVLDLKHEVNELLVQAGQPPRYPSAESDERRHPDV